MTKRLSELEEEAKRIRQTEGLAAHLDQKLQQWKDELALVCEEPNGPRKAWSLYLLPAGYMDKVKPSRPWPYCHPRLPGTWKAKAWKRATKKSSYICSADTAAQLHPSGTIAKQVAAFGLAFVIQPTGFDKPPSCLNHTRRMTPYYYGLQTSLGLRAQLGQCKDSLPRLSGFETPDLDNAQYMNALMEHLLLKTPQETFQIVEQQFAAKLQTAQENYEKEKARLLEKLETFKANVALRADFAEVNLEAQ